jgi:hypothetical protein
VSAATTGHKAMTVLRRYIKRVAVRRERGVGGRVVSLGALRHNQITRLGWLMRSGNQTNSHVGNYPVKKPTTSPPTNHSCHRYSRGTVALRDTLSDETVRPFEAQPEGDSQILVSGMVGSQESRPRPTRPVFAERTRHSGGVALDRLPQGRCGRDYSPVSPSRRSRSRSRWPQWRAVSSIMCVSAHRRVKAMSSPRAMSSISAPAIARRERSHSNW